ncbi:uncharacterized protein CLAFUR5_13868 [Fulvia fulva]|uniref:Uncharacterized protein n=1 Tax=Passalora fulva TaxID=5499 RepID=A0A9Q8PL73_PASFU|nr:uncharacterized protein CLAFUR5_13868 [Fulvia fulva]KAK4610784.1 hypothetical protein CLAFUR0_14035 [Fulvia fulva]UJO24561.1 hypothetical protein CLAFUR5_13868 [Fulvia fulva]WPV37324.1 hypothetical protein CLAFUW7_14039 [Fulvia fulva]
MASQRLRAPMLQFPPAIRSSVCQQTTSKRAFSSTNPRKADLSTAIASAPAALFDTLHAFMPWYIAIPTAAALVRGVLVYYVASLPIRKSAITRRHLYPLWSLQAKHEWIMYQDKAKRDARASGMTRPHQADAALALVRRGCFNMKAAHQVGSRYGAPMFTWTSAVNLAAMVAFTEALRIKCGSKEGLLPMILHPIEWVKDAIANPVPTENTEPGMESVESMTPDERLAERLHAAREAQEAGGLPPGMTDTELLEHAHHLSPLKTPEYAAYLDPTLQVEGLSWCPDLTSIDPTFTLPVALSLTIAATAFLRTSARDLEDLQDEAHKKSAEVIASKPASHPPQPSSPPQKQNANSLQAALQEADRVNATAPATMAGPLAHLTFRQRITLTVSMVFFLFALKLPAALLLYLVPSFAVGFLQGKYMDLKYPLPEVIRPSKRPMRAKVKKTLGDV